MPSGLVSRFIGLIEQRQLDDALELLTPECEYDNVPFGPITGVVGVRGVLAPFLERFDEVSWVITNQVSSGTTAAGVVMNERRDRFRLGERWIELPVAGLFVLQNERIALWRDYFDQGQLQRAMADLA